jgi:Ca2+-binding RTX toxin-like protein
LFLPDYSAGALAGFRAPPTSLGIATLLILALVPASAFAATASVEQKRLFYTAAADEVNDLTISASGNDYVLEDSEATISAGPGCSTSGSHRATCSGNGINGITVSLGDRDDSVQITTSTSSTLSGGDGNDSLEGGPGRDTLRGNGGVDAHDGGAGDDFIDSRGNQPDVVRCGPGNDIARADQVDLVAFDCETVDRGPPSSTPAPRSPAAGLLGPGETSTLRPGACAIESIGTSGSDQVRGTPLGDSLFGLQGDDVMEGFAGDDCLFGGLGADRLLGGEGADRLLGDDSRNGVGRNDRLYGKSGDDLLVGGSGKDRLSGGSGRDRLSGNKGNDSLSGGKGNDRLSAGRDRNRLRGGPGNDRLNGLNRRFDRLNCGRGRDRVRADRQDRVVGCERVRRR